MLWLERKRIVAAYNNDYIGAYLDNSGGTGTVTVNYSTFNGNADDGLYVLSSHAISLKNITTLDNGWDGAFLENDNALTAQPVTITSVNNFNFNGATGLVVLSRGAITAGNVTAMYNSGYNGAYLDNCDYDDTSGWCLTPGSYAVTLKGSNNFSNNGYDGLEAWASGAITANNLTADHNGRNLAFDSVNLLGYEYGAGVYLDNFGAPSAKPIAITGTNLLTRNGATGLWLNSYGTVTVNNPTANDNGLDVNCFLGSYYWTCDGMHVDW